MIDPSTLYQNALMEQQMPNTPLMPEGQSQQQPQQISQAQINGHHQHLSDMQENLKGLIETPDEELTLRKLFGSAADLVAKYSTSHGKNGVSAVDMAKELSSPDFPKKGPNGEQPTPTAIRKFLVNHFNKISATQAALTHHFGTPQQQATPAQSSLSNQLTGQ